jgi:hypothetical protein
LRNGRAEDWQAGTDKTDGRAQLAASGLDRRFRLPFPCLRLMKKMRRRRRTRKRRARRKIQRAKE